MTYAAFRSGTKTHTCRPHANEKAARMAWDVLSSRGAVVDMKLVDGLWMCMRPDGELDDVGADTIRQHVRDGRAWGQRRNQDAAAST